MAGAYRLQGEGGGMGSGVGRVRGRLPAGSGCGGLTVGESSAVSNWCVPWWPLVGWMRKPFEVYRIQGGTTVCSRAAVGCGCGACVSVIRVVGGGAWCVVLKVVLKVVRCGAAWGVVLGLASPGRVRDMQGRDGLGGGRPYVWARVFALCSLRGFFLCLSLASLLWHDRFFWGGEGACGWAYLVLGVGVGACRCRC